MKSNARGVFNKEVDSANKDMEGGVDMIYRVMKGRLKNRIRDKIEDVQKYTYWCLSFARRNLTRFVAILNFFDYTMSDPSRNIANACIFNYPR